jgi:hypothetical protein
MDVKLIAEDVEWMRKLRDSTPANESMLSIPPQVAFKLRLRGYVLANAHGQYAITLRGRDELIDRERG